MDRYPPYRTLLITLVILAPVVLFLFLSKRDTRDQWQMSLGLVPTSGVNPVPVSVFTTRKGPDRPVPDSLEESIYHESDDFRLMAPPHQLLDFPDGDTAKLYPFYRKLLSVPTDSVKVNILHFGDSQLEEDRITKYLRNLLNLSGLPVLSGGQICVKNLPRRGSAGIDLIEIEGIPLEQIFADYPPDLILFEYGINVVRAKTRNFNYYTRAIIKQINRFHELTPGVPVIMISVSDMADRVGGGMKSIETVPWVRDAQREASKETGSVFWDLYDFMGGAGSSIQWYQHDPPWIREDLTHFSFVGGERIAKNIFEALIWDIRKFEGYTP